MRGIDFKAILLPRNRGILMDSVMFVVQVLLFGVLARQFGNIAHASIAGDDVSKAEVTLFCWFLVILPSVGAILKRHAVRQRNPEFDEQVDSIPSKLKVFATVLYSVSQFLFLLCASLLLIECAELVFGKFKISFFTPLFFGLPALAGLSTLIFVVYFKPTRRRPLLRFFTTPQAELLGDVCLFLNMILLQMFWGYLMSDLTGDYKSVVMRLYLFCFTALFIYFPPRLFYLAEHFSQRRVWLVMLLANSPIILRLLLAP